MFYPKDNAGNQGTTRFSLDYIADEVGPTYVCANYSTTYNAGTKTGSITATIQVNDVSKVNPDRTLCYKWVPSGQDPKNVGWTEYEGAGDSATSLTLSISKGGLGSGSKHELHYVPGLHDRRDKRRAICGASVQDHASQSSPRSG